MKNINVAAESCVSAIVCIPHSWEGPVDLKIVQWKTNHVLPLSLDARLSGCSGLLVLNHGDVSGVTLTSLPQIPVKGRLNGGSRGMRSRDTGR